MESIINYFATIPSSHRSAILIGGIAFFWMAEYAVPLFNFKYNKNAICSFRFHGCSLPSVYWSFIGCMRQK